MFKKFIASAVVFFLWCATGFFAIIGISTIFQDLEIGTGVVILILGAIHGVLGWVLYTKRHLDPSVCWAVSGVLALLSLIMLSGYPWTAFDFVVALAVALAFGAYGFVSYRKKRHGPPVQPITGQMPNPMHVPVAPVDTSHLGRITFLAGHIADHNVRGQVAHLQRTARQILDFAAANPAEAHKATLFKEHYLPKTVELLEKYNHFAQKEVKTIAMYEAIDKICAYIVNMRQIYEHCLDSLYSDMVADINMDIDVLDQLMSLEGMDVES